jgi:hypothetical protein
MSGGAVRIFTVVLFAALTSACATFPGSVGEGVIEIRKVAESIECELAAVASDESFRNRDLKRWKALTDLDLTLVRTLGADGRATVTAPYGLATVSTTPSLGVSGIDTSIAHVQFVTPIGKAVEKYGRSCSGTDPSETRMGLATWLASALIAINEDEIIGVTYTKEFEILATAGARFGYTLIPVTNSVAADAGGAATGHRSNRVSVAMAPPAARPPPPKPVPVYIVENHDKEIRPRQAGPAEPGRHEGSSRSRALDDPTLHYLLQRKSPVKLSP